MHPMHSNFTSSLMILVGFLLALTIGWSFIYWGKLIGRSGENVALEMFETNRNKGGQTDE